MPASSAPGSSPRASDHARITQLTRPYPFCSILLQVQMLRVRERRAHFHPVRIAVIDMYPKGKGPKGPTVAEAVLAVQRQITEHFAPIWGCGASLSLRKSPGLKTGCFADDLRDIDGIIYISPKSKTFAEAALKGRKIDHASAFHYAEHAGIPCGFVFPEIAAQNKVTWSVLLSHEVLELIIDPDVNLLVGGVLPGTKHTILVAYEVCDPVQCTTYEIDGVKVGNFVTPQYFKINPRRRGRFDDTNYLNEPLSPFGVAQGGCYWYFDPSNGKWALFPDDDYGPFKRVRDELGDVPRTRRRIARFVRTAAQTQWETLWYGCGAYSRRCGNSNDGGN